jgi:hypothetical protein
MRQALETELLRIVQAVAFPSPGVVALAGRTAPYAGVAGPAPGLGGTADPLVAQLQQLTYHWCYCRRFDGRVAQAEPAGAVDAGFVEALSAANAGRERWDRGWAIQQVLPSGQLVAAKGALTRMVWPGEFLAHGGPGVPPRPGAEISLYAPRESRTLQPGFYFAIGEALSDQEDEFAIVRLYWNVRADGAARLVGILTQTLNGFRVPFRFKCLSTAALYDRTDAAVLYLAKRHYRIAAELMADDHPKLRELLEPATPLFSKELADGIGLAENPKTGESFGMHRCRLLAEAVCGAHARGVDTPEGRLGEVVAAFAAAGLSLDRPYLNPGSVDAYEFRRRATG